MQQFELAALVLFLLSYLYSGARAVFTPTSYKEEELRFYSSGKMKADEYIVFGAGVFSLLAVILHFVLETARIGEIALYVQIALFIIVLPFHFMGLFKARMQSTLKKKNEGDYRKAGMRKFLIGALMIAAPFIIKG
jgi:hypothetical protein